MEWITGELNMPSSLDLLRFPWIFHWQISPGVSGPLVTSEGESVQLAPKWGPVVAEGGTLASGVIRGLHPFQTTAGASGTLTERSRV